MDDNREQRIQNALSFLKENPGTPLSKVATQFGIPNSTLWARASGIHVSRSKAHADEQYLSTAQEEALLYWTHFQGLAALPLDRDTVRNRAALIKGTPADPPSVNWFKRFLGRHSDRLSFKKASPLDAKRAKNFNRATVEAHLKGFEDMLKEFGIPWANVYNMDEKGIQLGGGRKGNRKKYLFSREQRNRFRIKSDNLELVTVIEAVSADGVALEPGFVLQKGALGNWFEIEGVGRYAILPCID